MKITKVPKTKLLNGYYAPTKFYNEVRQNISAGVSAMLPDTLYKAKMLCEDKFWKDLPSDWWRRLAGRCFAHMVSTKQFPVKFVQYKQSCTNHYQIK